MIAFLDQINIEHKTVAGRPQGVIYGATARVTIQSTRYFSASADIPLTNAELALLQELWALLNGRVAQEIGENEGT